MTFVQAKQLCDLALSYGLGHWSFNGTKQCLDQRSEKPRKSGTPTYTHITMSVSQAFTKIWEAMAAKAEKLTSDRERLSQIEGECER